MSSATTASSNAIPLHARPQPQAGPSRPSIYTRVSNRPHPLSSSLPSLDLKPKVPTQQQKPTLAQRITEALRERDEYKARAIQRQVEDERVGLSKEDHQAVNRAWAIFEARKERWKEMKRFKYGQGRLSEEEEEDIRARRIKLPRYLAQALTVQKKDQVLEPHLALDVIRRSLRSPNPQPPPKLADLVKAISQFSPKLSKRRVIHQYLHPDLRLPSPSPSPRKIPLPSLAELDTHQVPLSTITLDLYLRNLHSPVRAKHARKLIRAFKKRGVWPDENAWRLIGKLVLENWDLYTARWCLAHRGGAEVLLALFGERGLLEALRERERQRQWEREKVEMKELEDKEGKDAKKDEEEVEVKIGVDPESLEDEETKMAATAGGS